MILTITYLIVAILQPPRPTVVATLEPTQPTVVVKLQPVEPTIVKTWTVDIEK